MTLPRQTLLPVGLIAALLCMGASPGRFTADGYGPVKVGMTPKQVEKALDVTLENIGHSEDDQCSELAPVGYRPQLVMLFEKGRLGRVSTAERGFRTSTGIEVGSSVAAVHKAYGKLERRDAGYDDPPAHDLVAWTGKGRGLRFEIGKDAKVGAIHAGNQTITYIEGCL